MGPRDALKGIPPVDRNTPRGPLLRWRIDQLMDAGLDELSARRVAADPDSDLHATIDSGAQDD